MAPVATPFWPRRQPPALSPLHLSSVAGALADVARVGPSPDPRAALMTRLEGQYEADRVVLTSNGTQALQLAITLAMLRGRADLPVALPAYTCPEVGSAAVGAGAGITLYDVDPVTLGPDQASLAKVLERGASALVVASLFGVPLDWDEISRMADAHGVTVIEDAAQGCGASWHGRRLGSLGASSVLSFGRGKGWTGGGGGALLERGEQEFVRLPLRPSHRVAEANAALKLAAQWVLQRPAAYGVPAMMPWLHLGETRYHSPSRPRAMTRASAVALERTWDAADREARWRRANAKQLWLALEGSVAGLPKLPDDSEPGWLRFPIRLSDGIASCEEPEVALGSGAMPGYPGTLADIPAVRARLVKTDRWLGSETLVRELITLPTHSLLTNEERERLVRAVV